MKLGHKLILAPVITALVVLAVGQLNSVFLSRASEATRERFVAEIEQLQSLSDVQDQVGRMHVDVYRLMTIIGSVDEARVTGVRAGLKTQAEGMQRVLGILASDPAADGPLKEEMARAGQQINEFVKKTDAAIDLASIDPNTGVAAMRGADEAYAGLATSLSSAKLRMKDASIESADASRAQAERTHWLLTLLSLAAAAAVVAVSWLVLRRVAQALVDASRVAREVAEGNLFVDVQTDRRDELGDLLNALGAMKNSLIQTVGQLRSATDSINTASVEIASGNQDLSARTEQAASNLQETAASMDCDPLRVPEDDWR